MLPEASYPQVSRAECRCSHTPGTAYRRHSAGGGDAQLSVAGRFVQQNGGEPVTQDGPDVSLPRCEPLCLRPDVQANQRTPGFYKLRKRRSWFAAADRLAIERHHRLYTGRRAGEKHLVGRQHVLGRRSRSADVIPSAAANSSNTARLMPGRILCPGGVSSPALLVEHDDVGRGGLGDKALVVEHHGAAAGMPASPPAGRPGSSAFGCGTSVRWASSRSGTCTTSVVASAWPVVVLVGPQVQTAAETCAGKPSAPPRIPSTIGAVRSGRDEMASPRSSPGASSG